MRLKWFCSVFSLSGETSQIYAKARYFPRRSGEVTGDIEWVTLPDGEEWLLRPVLEGLCRYESLKDGTIDLADLALLNDVLNARADNEALAYKMRVEQYGE